MTQNEKMNGYIRAYGNSLEDRTFRTQRMIRTLTDNAIELNNRMEFNDVDAFSDKDLKNIKADLYHIKHAIGEIEEMLIEMEKFNEVLDAVKTIQG